MSNQICEKSTKNITKILIFITWDTLKLKKIVDCERIYSVNPLYLLVNHANRCIEEKNGNKKKRSIKKYADLGWN